MDALTGEHTGTPATGRMNSLDVFRGLTIAGMILVNNPGTWDYIYSPLEHSKWHGWTPTDLVFPFFLFIVGVFIPLALSPRPPSAPCPHTPPPPPPPPSASPACSSASPSAPSSPPSSPSTRSGGRRPPSPPRSCRSEERRVGKE